MGFVNVPTWQERYDEQIRLQNSRWHHIDSVGLPTVILLAELIILCTILATGFTSAKSKIRWLLLLPVLFATRICLSAIHQLFGTSLASSVCGLAVFAACFQYLDVALIGQWDVRYNGPCVLVYGASAIHNEDYYKRIDTPYRGPLTLGQRLEFALKAATDWRGCNEDWQSNGVPRFGGGGGGGPSAKICSMRFIIEHALKAMVSFAVVAGLLVMAHSIHPVFFPWIRDAAIPTVTPTPDWTLVEIVLRTMVSVTTACLAVCGSQLLYSMCVLAYVLLEVGDSRSWRPLFGDFAEGYTLERFWEHCMHQLFRRQQYSLAWTITGGILGVPLQTRTYHLTSQFILFVIAGIMCLGANIAEPRVNAYYNVISFFMAQFYGVVLENCFFWYAKPWIDRRFGFDPILAQAGRRLGYFWVIGWLIWSLPAWILPMIATQALGPVEEAGDARGLALA